MDLILILIVMWCASVGFGVYRSMTKYRENMAACLVFDAVWGTILAAMYVGLVWLQPQ